MSIRLINTTTLQMKMFGGDNVPSYAILSHTWDGDEEVNYQEMTRLASDPDHPALAKSGYQKIIRTCKKAASHGFGHAWVDTCCIDKSSSAELSEAINSMFKWYEQAGVCYTYLADLPLNAMLDISLPGCRWFMRGWCLQELLAPKDLRLYDSEWNYIGSKGALKGLISSITTIDEDVLVGGRLLSSIPIARRMSWAAKRETKREEDIAYCLLGIFDVNMPMLYGEGSKAFIRLQEEIIKESNDLSIFFTSAVQEDSYDEESDYALNVWESDYRWQCRDLFARSPRNFQHCERLVNAPGSILSSRSFTLMNSGLYFKDAELLVHDSGTKCYKMPLKCYMEANLECEMILRKVGPGLFVRLRLGQALFSVSVNSNDEEYTVFEEASIIRQIKPALKPLLHSKHRHLIRIVSSGNLTLSDALQFPTPRDRWDCPGLQFLTRGEENFEASLKVFPHLAAAKGGFVKERGEGGFYLAYGYETIQGRKSPWAALFSEQKWDRLERLGENEARKGKGSSDTLDIGKKTVTVHTKRDVVDHSVIKVELSWQEG